MTIEPRLDAAFQARHLSVPMSQAFALGPDVSVSDANAMLVARGYDQAPVLEGDLPIGFVLIRHLGGLSDRSVRDAMSPLGSGNVVSGEASVGSLLEWIIGPGFLFVLEGRAITGFITVFDFNKQPARAHLYLLLARFESGLADLVRRRFDADPRGSLVHVSDDARVDILDRFTADEALNKESELVAYFDFSDLISVVHGDATLRGWIGGPSRSQWSRHTGGLVDLRTR